MRFAAIIVHIGAVHRYRIVVDACGSYFVDAFERHRYYLARIPLHIAHGRSGVIGGIVDDGGVVDERGVANEAIDL